MTATPYTTESLPDSLTYGFVADRVLLAIGDTTNDEDRFPDGVAAEGTVTFTPLKTLIYTEIVPTTVLVQPIVCTILQEDDDPKRVGLLVDPAGHAGNVALVTGMYEVAYKLQAGTVQKFRIRVEAHHTDDSPLWLPLVAPLVPDPSVKFVVNEQIYTDSLAARDEAEGFRDEVVTYHGQTVTLVNRAETAATTATTMAGEAETARDETLALGLTVDTSVGTRVFVGDTMIHGDTGIRDISILLDERSSEINLRSMTLRRTNNVVQLFVGIVSNSWSANAARIELFEAPYGFRIMEYARMSGDYEGTWIGAPGDMRSIRMERLGHTFDYAVSLLVSWVTPDDWPTELPGIPA